MSSIIDALKKSDQSRNKDNNKQLNNISFSDQPAPKSRRGFWLLVVVLTLIALAVYGWQQGWHQRLLNKLSAGTAQTSTTTQTPVQAETAPEPANPPAKKAQTINRLTPPKQADIKAQSQELASQPATPPGQQEQPQTKPAEEPAQPAQPNALTVVENRTRTDDQTTEQSPTTDLKEPAKADLSAQTADAPGQELQPKLKQDYLYIHQLDFAIRKNIPNVKISIHIYDPEPENRMLMINGEKFAIGDSIEGLVTVHDIVPEGVVLAYENIRFLLPK
jgi:general secretion pathway protein B